MKQQNIKDKTQRREGKTFRKLPSCMLAIVIWFGIPPGSRLFSSEWDWVAICPELNTKESLSSRDYHQFKSQVGDVYLSKTQYVNS